MIKKILTVFADFLGLNVNQFSHTLFVILNYKSMMSQYLHKYSFSKHEKPLKGTICYQSFLVNIECFYELSS